MIILKVSIILPPSLSDVKSNSAVYQSAASLSDVKSNSAVYQSPPSLSDVKSNSAVYQSLSSLSDVKSNSAVYQSAADWKKYCLFWHINMHSCPKLLADGTMGFCTPYVGTSLATHSPAQTKAGRYGTGANANNIVQPASFTTTVSTVEKAATDYTTIAHYKFGLGDPNDPNSNTGSISLAAGWAHKINAFAERTTCPSGFVPNPDGSCATCGPGEFGNTPTAVSPVAYVQNLTYTTEKVNDGTWVLNSYSQKFCVSCPRGTYWGNQVGLVVGGVTKTKADQATASCTQCAKGHYQDALGNTTCKECSAGTYQDNVGQNHCFPCSKGYYQDQTAQDACVPAPDGKYVDQKSSTTASSCPDVSMTTNGEGRTSASECVCPAGTYMQFSGYSAAAMTDPDTASTELRQKSFGAGVKCLRCPGGFSCRGGRVLAPNPWSTPTANTLNYRHAMPKLKKGFYATRRKPFEAYDCRNEKRCPGGNEPSVDYDAKLNMDNVLFTGGVGGNPIVKPVCGPNLLPDEQVNCVKCADDFYITNQMSECSECTDMHLLLNCLLFVMLSCATFIVYRIANSPLTIEMSPLLSASISLGVTVSMLQGLGLISSLAMQWESPLKELMGILKIFIFDLESFGTACYLGNSASTKLLSKQLLPFLIFLVYYVGAYKIFKADPAKCMNTAGMLLVGLFAAFSIAAFSPFSCYSGPNGKSVIQSSPGIHCDASIDSEYTTLALIGAVTIILYPICGMAYLFKTAFNAPSLSLDEFFVTSHRFMFFRFRPDRYFWLPFLLLRNTLIGFPPMLFSNPFSQALCVIVILLISLAGQMHYWPWRSADLNFFDAASCGLIILVLCFWFPTNFAANGADAESDAAGTGASGAGGAAQSAAASEVLNSSSDSSGGAGASAAFDTDPKTYSNGALMCLGMLFMSTALVFCKILFKMFRASKGGSAVVKDPKTVIAEMVVKDSLE